MEGYPKLIKHINNNYSELSKSQKLIADFIIENYDQAAFMTAAKLGKSINVSESTVVRFSDRLGYQGYRDLQNDLQELVKNKLTTVQRIHLQEHNYKNKENRSEEHTSELQSRFDLVCRLLLEKK